MRERLPTTRQKILANPSAADMLTDTVIALSDKRKELMTALQQCQEPDPLAIQEAIDRWEALVQPMLLSVKTGTLGDDNDAVATLGIQNEVDRLFNYSLVRPSVIREQLKQMKAEVRLWFREGAKGERKYVIDHGKITCRINGQDTSWNMSSLSP